MTKVFLELQGYDFGWMKAGKPVVSAGESSAAAEVCDADSGSLTAGLGFAAVDEARFLDMKRTSALVSSEASEPAAVVSVEVEQRPSRSPHRTASACGQGVFARVPAPAVCADCSWQQADSDSCSAAA